MSDGNKNAYEILGVPRTASADEIREAFRRRASETHPDTHKDDPEAHVKFQEINTAFQLLGKGRTDEGSLTKRREYDRSLRSSPPEGGLGGMQGQREVHEDFGELFNQYFRGMAGFGISGRPTQREPDEFKIPQNDLGLFYALREANRASSAGTWKVHKDRDDKRHWMPDVIYSVKRDGEGNVTIFRVLSDFRSSYDRKTQIKLKKEGKPWEYEEKVYDADARMHEHFVFGDGARRVSGSYNTPYNYAEYMLAMKKLAERVSKPPEKEGSYSAPEVVTINRYTEYSSKIRMEDRPSYLSIDDREVGRRIPFNKFWNELNKAGGNVEYVAPRSKEGGSSGGSPES